MIQLNNLSIGYNNKQCLKSNISETFNDNHIYGVLGESGKGKTTLLKTIAGLIKPIGGEVLINGKKSTNAKQSDIYMMHQNYTCFDWLSCLDNILITKKVRNHKITEEDKRNAYTLLQSVGLYDYSKYYPSELSGGMRQRLALARTMFVKPSIILMDEPLSALDETTRKEMQNLIIKHHEDTKNIIIMITHSKEEANRMCDKVLDFNKISK